MGGAGTGASRLAIAVELHFQIWGSLGAQLGSAQALTRTDTRSPRSDQVIAR